MNSLRIILETITRGQRIDVKDPDILLSRACCAGFPLIVEYLHNNYSFTRDEIFYATREAISGGFIEIVKLILVTRRSYPLPCEVQNACEKGRVNCL